MKQQISIVDDEEAVRESVAMLLESAGYALQVFESASAFLANGKLAGGCVIIDIRMPGMSGLELQEELARRHASVSVIIMTGYSDVSLAVRAMRTGALDFIEKPFDEQRMLKSVARALEVGCKARNRLAEVGRARDLLALLTLRERDVLAKLIDGQPNKLAAQALGISPRTIEIHRAKIMKKLAAGSLSDVVRISLIAA